MIKDYKAGDKFKINIRYTWYGSPHKDFTVKVYSKQDQIAKILNPKGKTNMFYTDGR